MKAILIILAIFSAIQGKVIQKWFNTALEPGKQGDLSIRYLVDE